MKTAIPPSKLTSESEEDVMGLLKLIGRKSDHSSFDEKVDLYLTFKAENTQRSYRSVISEWRKLLEARHSDINKPTEKDVFSYVSAMLQKVGEAARYSNGCPEPCTPATVFRKIVILKGFYEKYFETPINNGPFEQAHARLIKYESGSKRPTEICDGQQAAKLIEQEHGITKSSKRNKAFLSIIFGGGFRIGETLGLRISDVRQDGVITFLVLRDQKNKKITEQPLEEWAARAVLNLKDQRIVEGASPNDKLIVSYRGRAENASKGLSQKGGYNLFKDLCKIAGLPDGLSPHSGRATAATHLLLSGEDHLSVRDFLRHRSLAMVAKYDQRLKRRTNHPGLRLRYNKPD